jgi:hypothetical protein
MCVALWPTLLLLAAIFVPVILIVPAAPIIVPTVIIVAVPQTVPALRPVWASSAMTAMPAQSEKRINGMMSAEAAQFRAPIRHVLVFPVFPLPILLPPVPILVPPTPIVELPTKLVKAVLV